MAPLWSFVGCKVRAREVPDPNANTPITVTFTEEEFDTDAMWSAAEPTKVTIRRAGYYFVLGAARWPAGDGIRGVAVRKNGSSWPAETRVYVSQTQAMLQASAVVQLAGGDVLELETYFKGWVDSLPGHSDQALTVVRVG